MPRTTRPRPEPWLIHFFQRHPDDDPIRSCPTSEFFDSVPFAVAAEIHAVLNAVAEAPPPSFAGGGKWEAMHRGMAGFYEVRVQRGQSNYRLFCQLDRHGDDLGGPSIICLSGLVKPKRSAAAPQDYELARRCAAEFAQRRTVLS